MVNLLEVFLILTNCHFLIAIKFDTNHATVLKPKGDNHPHQAFGASVAILKSSDSVRYIIGAPRGNSNLITIPQTGLVYSCLINNTNWKSECHEIPIDTKSHKLVKIKSPFTSRMNLGLHLAVDQNSDLITICGHLHTYSNDQPTGICFLVNGIDGSLVRILSPRIRKTLISKKITKSTFKSFQSHEMFGFSSIFNNDSDSMIIGIPGFDIFHGAIMAISYSYSNPQLINSKLNTIKDLEQDSYLGYSLSLGAFYQSSGQLIAAGAPRSKESKGQVFIMSIDQDNYYGQVVQDLEGHQLGEYFGYSIQSIDLNRDNYHDLLIGAPLYMASNDPRGDSGRVYVYLSDGKQLNESPIAIDGDTLFDSRFGSSLAAIGDLNLDGFNDFAVGAPQENNGFGSVYIYSGATIISSKKYFQKIDSSRSFGLSGFGGSIFSNIDVNNDHCPDILIGCYMSDAAVLLRCSKED